MKRLSASLIVAALAVCVPGGIPAAEGRPSPADRDEAGERYDRGVELFKEGDFRAALIEFQRAYELAPNWAVLYNIGQVYYQLKDYANALVTLEQYLEEGGGRIKAKRRKSVQADIAKLRPRVALLDVVVDVDGAEVLIDDVVVGVAPLDGPQTVSAGRRKVTVIQEGREPVTKYVDVAGSEDATVRISVGGSPRSSTWEDDGGDTSEDDGPVSVSGGDGTGLWWIGWIVTGTLATASVITGVLALDASAELDDVRSRETSRDELDDYSERTVGLAVVTDVLVGSALVAGTITLIVMLTSDDADDANESVGRPARWRLRPGGSGVVLTF